MYKTTKKTLLLGGIGYADLCHKPGLTTTHLTGMTARIKQYHCVLLQIVYHNTSLGKKDLVSILGFS
jgi:hypothetical protein